MLDDSTTLEELQELYRREQEQRLASFLDSLAEERRNTGVEAVVAPVTRWLSFAPVVGVC